MPYKDRIKAAKCHSNWVSEHPEADGAYQIKYSKTLKGRYKKLCADAKRRGLTLDISREQHKAFLSLPCYWCGRALNETGSGLDRLDNQTGYIIGNVVPCCGDCNWAKKAQTVEEFKDLVRRIYERHGH